MENQEILREVMLRAKEDPWCRECLEQVQKHEAAFLAIRSRLTETEREQLDLYIGVCEAWCDSHIFVAYQLGEERR